MAAASQGHVGAANIQGGQLGWVEGSGNSSRKTWAPTFTPVYTLMVRREQRQAAVGVWAHNPCCHLGVGGWQVMLLCQRECSASVQLLTRLELIQHITGSVLPLFMMTPWLCCLTLS